MSRIWNNLVEAFDDIAGWPRSDVQAEDCDSEGDGLMAERIRAIRRSVAASTDGVRGRVPCRSGAVDPAGGTHPDVIEATASRQTLPCC